MPSKSVSTGLYTFSGGTYSSATNFSSTTSASSVGGIQYAILVSGSTQAQTIGFNSVHNFENSGQGEFT